MIDAKNNLLDWLVDYVTKQAREKIDARNLSTERYYTVLNDRVRLFMKNNNLSGIIGLIPTEFLIWNSEHEFAILDHIDRMKESIDLDENEKLHSLKYLIWLVAAVLSDFEQNNLEDTSEFKVLEEILKLLRRGFQQSFPVESERCESKVGHMGQNSSTSTRPSCVECGSVQVVSHGLFWQCKSCGRQFSKNPRRKPRT